MLRATALLQLARGVSSLRVAQTIPLTAQAIRKIGHRYVLGRLDAALYDKPRPGAAPLLDDTRSHSTSVMATAFAFSIRGRSGQLLRSGTQGPSRDSKGHSFACYGARFHNDEIGISGSASQSDCQPGIGSPIHNASWQNAAQGSKVPMCSTKQVGSRSGGHPDALCNGPRYFRPPFSHRL